MLRAVPSTPDLTDPAFAKAWQSLAAPTPSPFLGWDWIGCHAPEYFPRPLLIQALDGDTPVAAALFNRTRRRAIPTLHLHQSGDPALDAIFIEHNAPVGEPGRAGDALAPILRCALTRAPRLVLSGVSDATLAIARQVAPVTRLHTRPSPYLPLQPGGTLAPLLSRNTRAQLARSTRAYEADGPLAIHTATTADQALDYLDRLLPLHAATWSARGIASGFLAPAVQSFHRTLIRRGVPTGLVELSCITAGSRPIGYLYNLRAANRVAVYQSGFDYAAPPNAKPGLTSHAAAIAQAWSQGVTEYDFLAGDSRYKRSLSTHTRNLHWLELTRPNTLASLETRLESLARRILRRPRPEPPAPQAVPTRGRIQE